MTLLRWLGRGLLVLFGLLIAASVAGFAYEKVAEARDAKAYPPPGRMIDVGGQPLHILCSGPGNGSGAGPTVVLIGGGGNVSVADFPVQRRIARFARVCNYDRPGLGWSPPAQAPLSLDDQVGDLHALLAKAGAPGPYVLEPESFGGLIALAFTQRYPNEVAGLVMVDAAEPALWFGQVGQLLKTQGPLLTVLPILSHVGVVRLIAPSQLAGPEMNQFLPLEQAQLLTLESRPNTGIAEALGVYRLTPQNERGGWPIGALGDRPMTVIQHGKPFTGPNAMIEPGWAASQARIAQLSTDSRMIVARDNGHEIAQQNPDLVAAAAQDVVARVRARASAPRPRD